MRLDLMTLNFIYHSGPWRLAPAWALTPVPIRTLKNGHVEYNGKDWLTNRPSTNCIVCNMIPRALVCKSNP